jgi:hypothetical protein
LEDGPVQHGWWYRNIVEPGKLPLMLCFIAFVLTFLVTRTITRMIRAGRGPFRDQVTSSGTHIHHDIPGLVLLILGAFTAIGTTSTRWDAVSGVLIGIGVSLVLDEFSLIFHLKDTYWTSEGRLSINLVFLTTACLALALLGMSPFGVNDVGGPELAARISASVILLGHGVLVVVCLLKGKYPLAVLGLFIPVLTVIPAMRLARPDSVWYRRRYSSQRQTDADRRAAEFDERYKPVLRRARNLIGGKATPEAR